MHFALWPVLSLLHELSRRSSCLLLICLPHDSELTVCRHELFCQASLVSKGAIQLFLYLLGLSLCNCHLQRLPNLSSEQTLYA